MNAEGIAIVMVTHDPDLARRAHRNIQVVDGQVTDYTIYQSRINKSTSSEQLLEANA